MKHKYIFYGIIASLHVEILCAPLCLLAKHRPQGEKVDSNYVQGESSGRQVSGEQRSNCCSLFLTLGRESERRLREQSRQWMHLRIMVSIKKNAHCSVHIKFISLLTNLARIYVSPATCIFFGTTLLNALVSEAVIGNPRMRGSKETFFGGGWNPIGIGCKTWPNLRLGTAKNDIWVGW